MQPSREGGLDTVDRPTPRAVGLVLFPLVFVTNIWVETSTMPGWLQAIVDANPVTKVVIAVRGLMHGSATAGEIGWALLACAVIFAVFAPIATRLYNAKLHD